jgi:hypothetical protein
VTAQELYSKHLFAVLDYTTENYPLLDATATMTRMLVDLRHCNAVTDTGFIKWAYAYARQAADDMLEEQVSSIDEVIARSQQFDTNDRPPFVSMQHPTRPEITFVEIRRGRGGRDSHVWIVPTDRLGLVQILHPTVSVKFTRVANRRYAYLVKECRRQNYNGSWTTVERDLAGIWLGTDQPIEAVDGNYCNYLPENLKIYRAREDALDRAVHELRPEKDTLDWKPDAPTTTASASNKGKDMLLTKRAQGVEDRFEPSEAFIAQVAADIAVRKVQDSWGVKS